MSVSCIRCGAVIFFCLVVTVIIYTVFYCAVYSWPINDDDADGHLPLLWRRVCNIERRLLHWSNIVGASHSRQYIIWQYGDYASRGVREVCELGYPRSVQDEIQQHVSTNSFQPKSIVETRHRPRCMPNSVGIDHTL